jgi:hypothetical protein
MHMPTAILFSVVLIAKLPCKFLILFSFAYYTRIVFVLLLLSRLEQETLSWTRQPHDEYNKQRNNNRWTLRDNYRIGRTKDKLAVGTCTPQS